MYYTYMLRCKDNSIYTGITTDVERRFKEHSEKKKGKCAKYTGSRQALRMEAVWQSETRETASKLEFYIKKLSKLKKERLIADNDLFEEFFSKKIDCSLYKRKK